jgi:hypothetical protein
MTVPMGRRARPGEMGGPAVFLAIDGGLTVNAA